MIMTSLVQYSLRLADQHLTQLHECFRWNSRQGTGALINEWNALIHCKSIAQSIIYFEVGCMAGWTTRQMIEQWSIAQCRLRILAQEGHSKSGNLLIKMWVIGILV